MPDFVHPINLKKPIVNRKLIAWGFILSGLISVGSWAWGRNRVVGVKEEGDSWWGSVKITYTVTPSTPTPATGAIVNQLQSQIATASGQYSIYVYRLTDKTGYEISGSKIVPAASIMKVSIMAAAYRKIESGEIRAESVEGMLEAMGKRSDNVASAELIKLMGREFIRQTITDLGMAHTDFDQNTTTAYDVAVMWRNLYEGKLISDAHRDQMWEFLEGSIFEDRIAAGVPDGTRVIHKVGTDLDIWSDAGIVMAPRPFVMVILNQGVDVQQAKQLVPQLVKTIWNTETAGR